MLKKIVIAGSVSAVALLGVAGVAYADDTDIDCSSHDVTRQSNKGDQLLGGNSSIKDLNGFFGGSIDQPSFCPNAFNDNEIEH